MEKLEIRDAPRLIGAEISAFSSELCESKEQWMGIVSAIKSAEVLSVRSWFFQVMIVESNEIGLLFN